MNFIDGDRLSVLYANTVGKFLPVLNQMRKNRDPELEEFKLGVVHTAYANSAAIRYIKDTLGIQVSCCPTGVKFSHPEALKFDIGIYFESNGHGTIVFKDKVMDELNLYLKDKKENEDTYID